MRRFFTPLLIVIAILGFFVVFDNKNVYAETETEGLNFTVPDEPMDLGTEKYIWIDPDTIEASGGMYNYNKEGGKTFNLKRNEDTGDLEGKIKGFQWCDTLWVKIEEKSKDHKKGKLSYDSTLCMGAVMKSIFHDDLSDIVIENPNNVIFPNDAKPETCVIDGIGWILCPVLNFFSYIIDAAYEYIADWFLNVTPITTDGPTESLYTVWAIVRNIANIIFIITFLIIILSQVTSIGVSNYGIKKMLPRLVIAAILVNASYWICAIAVDLSNILGKSISEVFESINSTIVSTGATTGSALQGDTSTPAGAFASLAGGILTASAATMAVVYLQIGAFAPIALAACFTILTVFLVLTLRQALIIMLVILAPLAFVAYILPNTSSLFTKWRKTLQILLLIYPIISFMFGASRLASVVIDATSASIDNPIQRLIIQILSAGMTIIPLLLVPVIIKTSMNLFSKISGIIDNPNKGFYDKSMRRANEFKKYQQEMRDANILKGKGLLSKVPGVSWAHKSGVRRRTKYGNSEAGKGKAEKRYLADELAGPNGEEFARSISASIDPARIQAQGIQAAAQSKAENIAAAKSTARSSFQNSPDAYKQAFEDAIEANDDITAAALQELLIEKGSLGLNYLQEVLKRHENDLGANGSKATTGKTLRINFGDKYGDLIHKKAPHISIWANEAGTRTISDIEADSNTWKTISTSGDFGDLSSSSKSLALNSGQITPELARSILSTTNIQDKISPANITQLESIARTGGGTNPNSSGGGSPIGTPPAP